MKENIIFMIKLLIVILIGFIVYFNYDTIKYKSAEYIDKALTYFDEAGIIDIEGIGMFINDVDLKKLTDSGITGDSLSFSSTYYPYYEMLDANSRKIYKQIYANAIELKKNFIPVTNVSTEDLKDIIYAVNYDHPELFYLDSNYGYKYTQDNEIAQIILNYNETADNFEVSKNNFEREANIIIAGAKEYKSNYEREKYVHDTLLKNTEYKTDAILNQSAYSALVYKESVCAGYARSFQYIMTKLEIPTYYVTGDSKEGAHAWNLISLSDGFYNVDVTFDDTTNSHKYFNMEDNEFSENHIRTGLSLKLPSTYGSKFIGYRKVRGYVNTSSVSE